VAEAVDLRDVLRVERRVAEAVLLALDRRELAEAVRRVDARLVPPDLFALALVLVAILVPYSVSPNQED
jgi:hypothetical protein